jgi:hypothetical protein
MRPVIGLIVLLAGCAGPEYYRPAPPVTVAEPSYSGQVVAPPRSNVGAAVPASPNAEPMPCQPMPLQQRTTFVDWLRSGRGWTWGRASREPVRDEGLDRLMVDTLTNNRPQVSREPLPPAQCIPSDGETWTFPAAPNR